MTAASHSRRERRLHRTSRIRADGRVLIDKPPLLLDLKPVSLAELPLGQPWTPDMMWLEGARCDEEGNRLPPGKMLLKVPPHLRANTGANVSEIVRRFRRLSIDLKDYFDSFALFFPSAGQPDDGRPMWEPRTIPG